MVANGQRGKPEKLGMVACMRIVATCACKLFTGPVWILWAFHGMIRDRVRLIGFFFVAHLTNVGRSITNKSVKRRPVRIVAHETFGSSSMYHRLGLQKFFLVIVTSKTELLVEFLTLKKL